MQTEPIEGTNSALVLRAIRGNPSGLSGTQIRRLTAISPHQQVNQICHRLAGAGLTERRRGAGGPILNLPAGTVAMRGRPDPRAAPVASQPPRPTPKDLADPESRSPKVEVAEASRALFVITCSKVKVDTTERLIGPSILDYLPAELANELAAARRRVAPLARINERSMVPAWRRYAGGFYGLGSPVLRDATASGAHVLILSGGYGVVLAVEPIGDYDRAFRSGDWPHLLVSRCLAAYAERFELASVFAIAARSTGYAAAIRRVRWPATIASGVLISPDHSGGGAQAVVSRAAGEAFRELWRGRVSDGWRDSSGTPLRVEQLR